MEKIVSIAKRTLKRAYVCISIFVVFAIVAKVLKNVSGVNIDALLTAVNEYNTRICNLNQEEFFTWAMLDFNPIGHILHHGLPSLEEIRSFQLMVSEMVSVVYHGQVTTLTTVLADVDLVVRPFVNVLSELATGIILFSCLERLLDREWLDSVRDRISEIVCIYRTEIEKRA